MHRAFATAAALGALCLGLTACDDALDTCDTSADPESRTCIEHIQSYPGSHDCFSGTHSMGPNCPRADRAARCVTPQVRQFYYRGANLMQMRAHCSKIGGTFTLQ